MARVCRIRSVRDRHPFQLKNPKYAGGRHGTENNVLKLKTIRKHTEHCRLWLPRYFVPTVGLAVQVYNEIHRPHCPLEHVKRTSDDRETRAGIGPPSCTYPRRPVRLREERGK